MFFKAVHPISEGYGSCGLFFFPLPLLVTARLSEVEIRNVNGLCRIPRRELQAGLEHYYSFYIW